MRVLIPHDGSECPRHSTSSFIQKGGLSILAGGATVLAFVLGGLFGEFGHSLGLYPYSSDQGVVRDSMEDKPPSGEALRSLLDLRREDADPSKLDQEYHLLGTDPEGRDIFIRTLRGATTYAVSGLLAVLVSTFLGSFLGSVSGYYHGSPADRAVALVVSILDSIPRVVIFIVVAFASGFKLFAIALAISILNTTKVAHVVEGRIVGMRRSGFIEAAIELGVPARSIIMYHLLWLNCRRPIMIQMIYGFASVILMEATLSFIGYGVDSSWISWGTMITEGIGGVDDPWRLRTGYLWQSVPPAFAIAAIVIGLTLLADGLSKWNRTRENRVL